MQEARPQQGGLPAPRRSDEGQEPSLDEMSDRLGDHLFPTEEELRIVGLEPCETLVGAHVCGPHVGRLPWCETELGLLGEDRALESLELGPRLDAELLDEHPSGARESIEGFGLPARSEQRRHQLAPPAFAERLLANHGLEPGDQRSRVLVRQFRVDQVLERRPPKLVESLTLGRAETRVSEVLVRGPAPEPEGLLEECDRIARATRTECAAAVRGQLLEPHRIDEVSVDLEGVARSASIDQLPGTVGTYGQQGTTPPPDVRHERPRSGYRRLTALKLLGEIVRG